MQSYCYVATAHQSSSVLASVPLIFKGETLLLIGTTSKLTIKKIFNSQSKEITSCEVNARIATIQTIKHDNDNDFIFLTTEKYQVAILALRNKEENQEEDTEYFFETVYTDSIRENIGRPVDCGQLLTKVAEDLFCLHLYQGLLLFIPTNIYKGKVSKSRTPNTKFRQRIEELNVISMASFTSFHNLKSKQQKKLKIALLCVDSKEKKFIKIYSINMELLCIESDAMFDVEADSNFLIPANFESNGDDNNSGFFIVGECQIIYYKRDGEWLTYRFLKSTIYKCFTPINRISLLLGDFDGNLMLLTVKNKKIVMEHLGKTSMANSLAYLDNGIVFLGSHFGDSKLLKLLEDAEDTMQLDSCDNNSEVEKNYILELETYENLSPIVDFVVVDLLKRGQSQMVACCGGYKSASLKVIGQGLGIDELISMDELTFGSLGMWSLRQSFDSDVDDAIVFSFYEETRMIAYISESILGEIKNLGDFDYNKCTVNCGNVNFNLIVQVTSNSVLLLTNKTKGFKKIDEFITENEKEILFASIIFNQVLIGLTGGELIYFKISKSSLKIISRKEMHQDISCLSLGDGVVNGDSNNRNICAVGYWDCTVCLYSLPDFECVDKEHLPNDVISRSIMIKTFDDVDYILVAQGDGNLNFLQITKENNVVKGFVKYMSSTYLGLEPVTLFNLKSVDVKTKKLADGVLVASDRPTIINASNGKFLYSSVNLKNIKYMCNFRSKKKPNAIAIDMGSDFMMGEIDQVQRLHVKSYDLNGEMGFRLSQQESSQTFGVITTRTITKQVDLKGKQIHRSDSVLSFNQEEEVEEAFFKIFDDQSFEVLDSYKLLPYETGLSCNNLTLGESEDSLEDFYFIGTAFLQENEDEPSKGRILTFKIKKELRKEKKLTLINEILIDGAVYEILKLNYNKIVAGINQRVQIFKFFEEKIYKTISYHGQICTTNLNVLGNFIYVGDLVESVTILSYTPPSEEKEEQLTEIAKDTENSWISALENLNMDNVIGADSSFNLFTLKRQIDLYQEEGSEENNLNPLGLNNSSFNSNLFSGENLKTFGEYHLGDFVNRFRKGSLVRTDFGESYSLAKPKLLFVTVSGMIGVIGELLAKDYFLLKEVEKRMRKVLGNVGDFCHEGWRNFQSLKKKNHSNFKNKNFLDGDYLEKFLDLNVKEKYLICENLKYFKDDGEEVSEGSLLETEVFVKMEVLNSIFEGLKRIH